MHEGLTAPTEDVAPETLTRMREFLDQQRAIALAVWVRHEQQGIDGPLYDHHTMLGVDDQLYADTDLWALERGIRLSAFVPGWLDLFPLSEVEALRPVGQVLWERAASLGADLDPLDFRFTWEPLEVQEHAAASFANVARGLPELRRVEASRELLWKNGHTVQVRASFWLDFVQRRPGDFDGVKRALRESGISPREFSITAELPRVERVRTAVLYER
jgi:hypothetical protein